MDTQQLLELYKESLESVLKCLQDKKCSADEFGKLQELQEKIPSQTECEDYKDFVKTSKLVREQLDTHVRKVDDCGLVLKRIWKIRKTHKDKMKLMSTTLTLEDEKHKFSKHLKVLIDMEKMIESIGKMDEIPVKSPDDASSQASSQERNKTENVSKNQKSTDVHKEGSADEGNQNVVTGDNSKPICQQPINDTEEMNTEKDKEPQNEDVVKGDESKRREELDKTKTELDEMTAVHNSQKEEENGMIKEHEIQRNECEQLKARVEELERINASLKDENDRLEKQRSECDQLKEQVKELVDSNPALKDENKRYKMHKKEYKKATKVKPAYEQRWDELEDDTYKLKEENTKLKRRLDRPQAPISVQVKELQKRIDDMTAENESLIKRLKSQKKYTKETERSEQRSLRPQTAPHSSARQYTELQNQIDTLKAEKESLMQRLSMVAGMKMRDNNPGIADLSDPNRPEKIAEQFREIYDNAWTNLLDYITENTDATDDITVQQIVTATQKIFEKCQKEIGDMKLQLLKSIGYPEDTFEKQYTGGKDGHDPIVKMVKDLAQISAEHIYERVLQKIKEIGEIKTILQIGGKSADVFLTKCSKLCLFMCVKDPPVVLDFNFQRGDPFNKDKLSAFTKAGDIVDYLVWPVMYLNENGPVMSKGVAQGRRK